MADQIQEAIQAAKSGEKEKAFRLLTEVIKADPRGKYAEQAWMWLALVVDSLEKRRKCLDMVLSLNPDNEWAKRSLAQMQVVPTQSNEPALVKTVVTTDLEKERARPSEQAEQSLTTVDSEGTEPAPQEGKKQTEKVRSQVALTVELSQLLGIAGSVLLIIGVFAPLVSAPIVGNVNYFRNGQGDGVIVLVLAVISLILATFQEYRWLWVTSFASLGFLSAALYNLLAAIRMLRSTVDEELAGNLFSGLADLFIESIQIQWGWASLIAGTAMILVAVAIKRDRPFAYFHLTGGFLLGLLIFAGLIVLEYEGVMAAAKDLIPTEPTESEGSEEFAASSEISLAENDETKEDLPVMQPGELIVYDAGELKILRVHVPTAFYVVESSSLVFEGVEVIPGITYAGIEFEFTCSQAQVLCGLPPEADLTLMLADGRSVEDDDYSLFDAPVLGGDEVASGRTAKGWRVFQIPEDATIDSLVIAPFDSDSSWRALLPLAVNGYEATFDWVVFEDGNSYQLIPKLRQELVVAGLDPRMAVHIQGEGQNAVMVQLCETDVSFYLDEEEVLNDYRSQILTVANSVTAYYTPEGSMFILIEDCESIVSTELAILFTAETMERWVRRDLAPDALLDKALVSID